jgi:hypothetical protein
MYFGGQYVHRIHTSRQQKVENMKVKDWKKTEKENEILSKDKLSRGQFKANLGKHWGKAILIKNFQQEIQV